MQKNIPIEHESGFRQLVGYDVELSPRQAHLTLELEAKHLNRGGVLHGGVLMTLFDAACGYACMAFHDDPQTPSLVTVSMNTNFMASVDKGVLRIEAKITGGGRSTVFTEAEAFDEAGQVIATATGIFRRLRRPVRASESLKETGE
jgi:acyl-CoA thioesterase